MKTMNTHKAIVKVRTKHGFWCLSEIKGLKEGMVVEGRYDEKTKMFEFTWAGQPAVLVVGENAELGIKGLNIPYEIGKIVVSVAVCKEGTQDTIEEFETMAEARSYVRENELGKVDYWYLAAEIINENGDLNIAVWDKKRINAVRRLKRTI